MGGTHISQWRRTFAVPGPTDFLYRDEIRLIGDIEVLVELDHDGLQVCRGIRTSSCAVGAWVESMHHADKLIVIVSSHNRDQWVLTNDSSGKAHRVLHAADKQIGKPGRLGFIGEPTVIWWTGAGGHQVELLTT